MKVSNCSDILKAVQSQVNIINSKSLDQAILVWLSYIVSPDIARYKPESFF